jgi:hypothetical protein
MVCLSLYFWEFSHKFFSYPRFLAVSPAKAGTPTTAVVMTEILGQ